MHCRQPLSGVAAILRCRFLALIPRRGKNKSLQTQQQKIWGVTEAQRQEMIAFVYFSK
jgi:hypothetical protein